MKEHIKFPKIGQFRNVVKDIKTKVSFLGLDEQGEPIFSKTPTYPKIKFLGTVKLHGTNASVCYNESAGIWYQSRNNVITHENDNADFAKFTDKNKTVFIELIQGICSTYDISPKDCTVSIYGEWAGEKVQKNVGISNLERAFYIFDVKITYITNPEKSYWIDYTKRKSLSRANSNIYDLFFDFPTYEIEIDFSRPQQVQNTLIEYTEKVEQECPVANHFGIKGIGEGIVWRTMYKEETYRFKVKGEKHSSSKVKKLAQVDTEKLGSIQDFVKYSVTSSRFNQAIENVTGADTFDSKYLGDVIRWVLQDIHLEESDTLSTNELTPKDVNKYLSNKVREMYFAKQTF